MKCICRINGIIRTIDSHPLRRLLDILREDYGLMGTKEGCGEGECGACAVILDGRLVNSCMIPAMQLRGKNVLTIEGLGGSEPDLLQRAFVEEGAVQCGFCTPGMVMAARALFMQDAKPSREKIREALAGNLCRCTGYEQIIRAVLRASDEGYGDLCEHEEFQVDSSVSLNPDERRWCFLPSSLPEAVSILDMEEERPILFSGGTDIFPDMKNGKTIPRKVLDLSGISSLQEIALHKGEVRISCCVTAARIWQDDILGRLVPVLCNAARSVGAIAIQNRATIGGNIANASAAADMPVSLLALDASITLESVSGKRILSLEQFYDSYRKTNLNPNELLSTVSIPIPPEGSIQEFVKRGSRASLTLSRMSMAFLSTKRGNGFFDVRIAAGSMSPVPMRLRKTEAILRDHPLSAQTIEKAIETAGMEISPRKSRDYRRFLSVQCIRKHLKALENA